MRQEHALNTMGLKAGGVYATNIKYALNNHAECTVRFSTDERTVTYIGELTTLYIQ